MVEHDCGEIPVVDGQRKPVGVITDRDIACRAVAEGRDANTAVREVMSTPRPSPFLPRRASRTAAG